MTTTTIEGRWIPTGYSERTHESLPAVVYVDEQNIRAIAYRGKSKKPAWNYRFQSAAHMESEIKTFFGDVAEAEAYKQERRDERKNFVSALIPGDIVYTSWGYDQTNVEFYEIIGKKNKRVTLREIRAKTTETGNMSGHTIPLRGEFIGEPFTRLVSPGERVKIDNVSTGYPYGEGRKISCSWYH
jgi:hypothetical protein